MKTIKVHSLFVFVLLLIPLALSACSGAMSASSWPGLITDQNNAYIAHGQYVYAVGLTSGSMGWRFPEKANTKGFYAHPGLTPDNQLIVGGYDNVLYSINPQNGTQNWTYTPPNADRWISGVLVADQDIYVPNANHYLYDINPQGKEKWNFKTNNSNWAAPAIDADTLYLTSMDHFLYAISRATGKQVWKVDLGAAIPGSPALSPDGTLYVGTMGNEIVAVRAKDGQILWRFTTSGGVWSGPVLQDNTLYFGDLKGTFYGVDTATQKATIQLTPGGVIVPAPLLLTDRLVVVTETGTVQAVDLTGKVLWNHTINGKLYTTPVQAGDHILIAVTQGDQLLVSLDQNGNQVWAYAPPK